MKIARFLPRWLRDWIEAGVRLYMADYYPIPARIEDIGTTGGYVCHVFGKITEDQFMRIEGVQHALSSLEDVWIVQIDRAYDADSVKGLIREIIHRKENQLP